MTRFIRTVSLFLVIQALSSFAYAQKKKVYLEINHLMDTTKLYLNRTYTNWDGIYHNFERSNLYMSEWTLFTKSDSVVMNDKIVLADYNTESYLIGELDIDSIEALQFHLGVPKRLNHLDPAQYEESHPLAPKLPSMHWGWSAGYRFFVFEGYCDNDADYSLEQYINYHAVGSHLYSAIKVDVEPVYEGDSIVLYLDMNYLKLYENLDVIKDREEHGGGRIIQVILDNFVNNGVFSGGDADFHDSPNGTNELTDRAKQQVYIYPNPCVGQGNISFDFHNSQTLHWELVDLNGRKVAKQEFDTHQGSFSTGQLESGIYLSIFYLDGIETQSTKLVVY